MNGRKLIAKQICQKEWSGNGQKKKSENKKKFKKWVKLGKGKYENKQIENK